MRLTIYTDGSARPVPTTDPSVSENHAGWGLWGYEEGVKERDFHAYSAVGKDQSNNRAELLAVINAIKISHSLKVEGADMFIDSKYVQEGCDKHINKWIKNGWKTTTGDVKNIDLWKEYLITVRSAERVGMTFTYNWVKGHSEEEGDDKEGNDNADGYARMASAASGLGKMEPVIEVSNFAKTIEDIRKEKEATELQKSNSIQKKAKKEKVPDKNPLIIGSRVVLLTSTEPFSFENPRDSNEPYNVTYSMRYSASKVLDREAGVESADSLQCLTVHKDSDFQLDKVREVIKEINNDNTLKLPAMVYWDTLTVKAKRKEMFEGTLPLEINDDYGFYIKEVKDRDTGIMVPQEAMCVRVLKFPRRAWDIFDHFEPKVTLADLIMKDEVPEEDKIDITDMFVIKEEDKKGKVKLKPNPDIKGKQSVKVKAWDGFDITLSSAIDIFNFNNVSSLIKPFDEIKITLVRSGKTSALFRTHVIVDTGKDFCIIDNPYSNRHYFPKIMKQS